MIYSFNFPSLSQVLVVTLYFKLYMIHKSIQKSLFTP